MQHKQNPPPVITLYKWAIQGKSGPSNSVGSQWAQEPKEVKNFFSNVFQSLKHAKSNVDFRMIQDSWLNFKDSSSNNTFIDEEDTSDQSLCFSPSISSIPIVQEEDFNSNTNLSFIQEESMMLTSTFLQQNTMNEIEFDIMIAYRSFCKVLNRLTLNSKNVDDSFVSMSKLIL